MFSKQTQLLIQSSIEEDIGSGDITTLAVIPDNLKGSAQIIAKEDLVVCGHEVVDKVFHHIDSDLIYAVDRPDGVCVKKGGVIARVTGKFGSIFTAERVCLNFLQRLSGIASITHKLVSVVGSTKVKLLDTRKTTPGWRELEKYAVRVGGGVNHRFGLFDAVLIKNNHIDAIGGDVYQAVIKSKQSVGANVFVEVEVRDFEELKQALKAKPDGILLDNMTDEQVRRSVEIIRSDPETAEIKVEASGGINPENILLYASTGVDTISLGMLTHSVRSVDIALHYEKTT